MLQNPVKLSIPFESLVESLKVLDFREKYQIWELLEKQMGEFEEKLFKDDPSVQLQIQEARAAYQSGDYVTIDEYVIQRSLKSNELSSCCS